MSPLSSSASASSPATHSATSSIHALGCNSDSYSPACDCWRARRCARALPCCRSGYSGSPTQSYRAANRGGSTHRICRVLYAETLGTTRRTRSTALVAWAVLDPNRSADASSNNYHSDHARGVEGQSHTLGTVLFCFVVASSYLSTADRRACLGGVNQIKHRERFRLSLDRFHVLHSDAPVRRLQFAAYELATKPDRFPSGTADAGKRV